MKKYQLNKNGFKSVLFFSLSLLSFILILYSLILYCVLSFIVDILLSIVSSNYWNVSMSLTTHTHCEKSNQQNNKVEFLGRVGEGQILSNNCFINLLEWCEFKHSVLGDFFSSWIHDFKCKVFLLTTSMKNIKT